MEGWGTRCRKWGGGVFAKVPGPFWSAVTAVTALTGCLRRRTHKAAAAAAGGKAVTAVTALQTAGASRSYNELPSILTTGSTEVALAWRPERRVMTLCRIAVAWVCLLSSGGIAAEELRDWRSKLSVHGYV